MKKILSIYMLGLLLLGCSFIEDTEEVISSNLNSEKTDSLSEDKTTKATSVSLGWLERVREVELGGEIDEERYNSGGS